MMVSFALPGDSVLHRYDPRAKLAGLLVMIPIFLLPEAGWVPPAYAAATGLLILFCLGPKELGRCLRAILPLLVIIAVLTPILRRGGAPAWRLGNFVVVTTTGLGETIRLLGRFSGLTLAFYAAFRTLDLDEFVLALRWYGLPFRPALTLTMAFRFIPTIAALYQNVQEAHSLRAAGDHRGGFFRRILPQLTAVFIQSIRMVPSLAMALEIRGVGRSTQRTQWRSLPQGGRPASWVATAALALAVYVPVAFGLLS